MVWVVACVAGRECVHDVGTDVVNKIAFVPYVIMFLITSLPAGVCENLFLKAMVLLCRRRDCFECIDCT